MKGKKLSVGKPKTASSRKSSATSNTTDKPKDADSQRQQHGATMQDVRSDSDLLSETSWSPVAPDAMVLPRHVGAPNRDQPHILDEFLLKRFGGYQCSVCPHRFLTKGERLGHMRGHNPPPPLPCEICDKEFKNVGDLNAHRWVHSRKADVGQSGVNNG